MKTFPKKFRFTITPKSDSGNYFFDNPNCPLANVFKKKFPNSHVRAGVQEVTVNGKTYGISPPFEYEAFQLVYQGGKYSGTATLI